MIKTTTKMMNTRRVTSPEKIFLAPRGIEFRNFIGDIFHRAGLPNHVIGVLTSPNNMNHYSSAFTSIHVSKTHNYETFEQLGDAVAQHFLIQYSYSRWPILFNRNSVAVVARIKIKYGSKQTFAMIAESNNFFPFISETYERRSRYRKDLLEDTLESFIGATEMILNMNGFNGFSCCYDVFKYWFDKIDIPLTYENLFDPKTRLKELFDKYSCLGKIEYETKRNNSQVTCITRKNPNCIIGIGYGSSNIEALMNSSQDALNTLQTEGYNINKSLF